MLHEVVGDARLSYQLDEFGNYYGFRYQQSGQSESWYSYVFNAQGDVIGIVDTSGQYVAKYSYDAWGKPVAITDGSGTDVSANAGHIANINPIRYRGYYFDKETGLYFLQSRYYDPVVGRFINADGNSNNDGALGTNMFAYCINNPINMVDYYGREPITLTCLGLYFLGSLIIGALTYVVADYAVKSIDGTSARELPKLPELTLIPGEKPKPKPVPQPQPLEPKPSKPKGKFYDAMLMGDGLGIVIFMSNSFDADTAKIKVLKGLDVWTPNKEDAKNLAIYASGGYIGEERGKAGNCWHFHLKNRGYKEVHIFYGNEGIWGQIGNC